MTEKCPAANHQSYLCMRNFSILIFQGKKLLQKVNTHPNSALIFCSIYSQLQLLENYLHVLIKT